MPVRFSNNASTTTTEEEIIDSSYLAVVDISSFPQFGTNEGDWTYVSVGDDVLKVTGIGLLFSTPVLFLDVPLTQVIPAGTVVEIRATAELLGDLGGEASLTINYSYTALAEQTTFTGSDNNGLSLLYTASAVHVFLNGVLLDAGDYAATNGTSVVLAGAASADDTLQIISYGVVNADPIYREGTAVLSTGETGAAKFLREDGDGTSSWQAVSIPSSEGTAVLSTDETAATKFLREDGDGTSSWQEVPAGGTIEFISSAVFNGESIASVEMPLASGYSSFKLIFSAHSSSVGQMHWRFYQNDVAVPVGARRDFNGSMSIAGNPSTGISTGDSSTLFWGEVDITIGVNLSLHAHGGSVVDTSSAYVNLWHVTAGTHPATTTTPVAADTKIQINCWATTFTDGKFYLYGVKDS